MIIIWSPSQSAKAFRTWNLSWTGLHFQKTIYTVVVRVVRRLVHLEVTAGAWKTISWAWRSEYWANAEGAGHCGTLGDISIAIDLPDSHLQRMQRTGIALAMHCLIQALEMALNGKIQAGVSQPLFNSLFTILFHFFTYLTCKLFAVNTLRYATSMRPKKQEQKDWDQSAVSKTLAAGGKLGTWSTPALHFVLPTAECVGVGDDWNTSTFIGRKRSSFATRRTPTRINLVSSSKNYWHDSGLTQVSTAWGFKIYDSGLATRPTAGSMS